MMVTNSILPRGYRGPEPASEARTVDGNGDEGDGDDCDDGDDGDCDGDGDQTKIKIKKFQGQMRRSLAG